MIESDSNIFKKTHSQVTINIPTCLTLFRIIVIPIIVWIYLSDLQYGHWYNTILFTLAGISDALDGYLARRWNQATKLGAFLDPVSDKLLVAILLILIATDKSLQSLLLQPSCFILAVLIIIAREITISALREWMAELGQRANVAVSVVGKYKTGIQMTAIGFLLFQHSLLGLPVLQIGEILLYMAAVLTIWSMFIYLSAAYRTVKNS